MPSPVATGGNSHLESLVIIIIPRMFKQIDIIGSIKSHLVCVDVS